MTWIVVGAIALAVAAVAAWLGRSGSTPPWHDAERSERLRSLLAARGLEAEVAPKAPVPMPTFRLPLAWEWRTRAGVRAVDDGGALWLIYDSELRRGDVSGCNAERHSDGDHGATVIARHTVVAVRSEGRRLPGVIVVPNVRRGLEEALPERFREAGLGGSMVAGVLTRAAVGLSALREPGKALVFEDSPDFAAAFRVAGDEGPARPLFDRDTIRLLLAHPWAIVEAQGPWLAVSRNVAPAYATREEGEPFGLLSVESAAELLELGARLVERWAGAGSGTA